MSDPHSHDSELSGFGVLLSCEHSTCESKVQSNITNLLKYEMENLD